MALTLLNHFYWQIPVRTTTKIALKSVMISYYCCVWIIRTRVIISRGKWIGEIQTTVQVMECFSDFLGGWHQIFLLWSFEGGREGLIQVNYMYRRFVTKTITVGMHSGFIEWTEGGIRTARQGREDRGIFLITTKKQESHRPLPLRDGLERQERREASEIHTMNKF